MNDTIRNIKFHREVLQQVTTIQGSRPDVTLSKLVNDALRFYISEYGLLDVPSRCATGAD